MRPWLRVLTPLMLVLTFVLLSGCSSEQYIVMDPKGPIGESQKDLIWITTILCAAIVVPVLVLTGIIAYRYRDRKGSKAAYTPEWEHSTKLETIWWGIPIVVIIALALVTAKYTYALEPSKPIESAKETMTIQVTSLDWKWMFNYPEQGITTVNYLQIPEDVPIKFELTSDTAMNSFWIPQLGGQMYTMSGMAMTLHLQADEQGRYFGTGANFTGKDFAKMTFDVNATSEEEFNSWVEEVKDTSPALTMEGFEQLRQPGTSGVVTYSSFPEGLFNKIMAQYAVGGSAHQHHGGGHSAETDHSKDAQEGHSDSNNH